MVTIVTTLLFSFSFAGPNYEHEDYDYDDEDDGIFAALKNIVDKINNLPGTIAGMVGSVVSSFVETIALDLLQTINNSIIALFTSLEGLLTDTNLDINHSTVKAIFNILRPTATTFAALFLIIQITKSAATFEAIDITRTMKYLLFFVLAIFFIDNSLYVLDLIIGGFGNLTGKVLTLGFGSFTERISIADLSQGAGGHSFLDSVGSILLSIALSILVFFMALSLYITLALRSIEILIMAATSGLFASTLASDSTMDVFKSFIKTFIATVSSTLFMAIGFALFTSLSNIQFIGGDYSYIDTVIKLTAILTYCVKTPQTVRSILGYGSPTVNALSTVKSMMFR